MRKLFLVRHCEPDISQKDSLCLGRSDLPLREQGSENAQALRLWLKDKGISYIYTSPLLRCLQTAGVIADDKIPMVEIEDLIEINAGEWEGKSFTEIREGYPEEYEKRGKDLWNFPPPKGESFREGYLRFSLAIEKIIKSGEGNIVVIAHKGVNCAWLCQKLRLNGQKVLSIPQPYGGITEIQIEENKVEIINIGIKPEDFPKKEECRKLLERYKTPKDVIEHGLAVADLAIFWARQLNAKRKCLDENLLYSSAVLHDIAKGYNHHSHKGEQWLLNEGYPKVAGIIGAHHSIRMSDIGNLSESALVYLADKRIMGTEKVSLKERFDRNSEKCNSYEAIMSKERQLKEAYEIEKRLKSEIGENYEIVL